MKMSTTTVNMELAPELSDKDKRGVKRKEPVMDFSFCDLCQVKLNSASQADMHFSGKVHLAKTRTHEPEKAEVIPGPSPAKKPAIETTKKPTNEPVKKPANDTPGISLFCSVCNRSFNSVVQAQAHYSGKAHAFRLQMINLQSFVHEDKNLSNPLAAHVLSSLVTTSGITPTLPSSMGILPLPINNIMLPPPPPSAAPLTPVTSTNTTTPLTSSQAAQVDVKLGSNIKTQVYRCDACCVTLNSDKQWEQHHRGLRHKIAIGKAKPPPPAQQGWEGVRFKKIAHTLIGISTSSGSSMGSYYCEDCDITVNSQKQLDQHLTSEKHKRVVSGEVAGRGRGKGRGAPPGRGKPSARGKGAVQLPTQVGRGTGISSTPPPLSSSFVLSGLNLPDIKPAAIRGVNIHARGVARPPFLIPQSHVFGRGFPLRGILPTDILFGGPQIQPQQVWI